MFEGATLRTSPNAPASRQAMHPHKVRTAGLVTSLVVALLVVPAPALVAADDMTPDAAESRLVGLINRDRAAAGLVPVRVDERLREIARARSQDMATRSYFSHEQPDGRNVFDLITSRGITWYGAGEILAWNSWAELDESAAAADTGWLESAAHRAIVLSTDYNYVGVGLALAPDGRKLWTGVFMKGPDRTRPAAQATGVSSRSATQVRFAWRGSDIRLQSLTAGLRDFQVQRRQAGGSWAWLTRSTTSTARTVSVSGGRRYEFRVRARDRAGNVSRWSTPLSILT